MTYTEADLTLRHRLPTRAHVATMAAIFETTTRFNRKHRGRFTGPSRRKAIRARIIRMMVNKALRAA